MKLCTIKWMMIATGALCWTEAWAQEANNEKWTPELGVELTSELQGVLKADSHSAVADALKTASGATQTDYNFVNLLWLETKLPIGRGVSVDLSTLSTGMTHRNESGAAESIGAEHQTCSNLDAENVPFALAVAGVNWTIPTHNRGEVCQEHSLFVGIRNMNEDYFVSPVTSFFTQSTCGIFPTLSCNYDVANYPNASVGAHYRFNCSSCSSCSEGSSCSKCSSCSEGSSCSKDSWGTFIVQASLYNGRGYHRFAGRENVFRFCPHDDGLFGLTEVSYSSRRGSLYSLGVGIYADSEGVSASPWFYTEQRLSKRLAIIAGYSHAFCSNKAAEAECSDFVGLGAHCALPKVELGLFTDYARFADTNEWATELTCKTQLTPHIFLQPTLHFVVTPAPAGGTTFQTLGLVRLGIEI